MLPESGVVSNLLTQLLCRSAVRLALLSLLIVATVVVVDSLAVWVFRIPPPAKRGIS